MIEYVTYPVESPPLGQKWNPEWVDVMNDVGRRFLWVHGDIPIDMLLPLCDDESDQRLYVKLTAPGYPLTQAQRTWLDTIAEHNGLPFKHRPSKE